MLRTWKTETSNVSAMLVLSDESIVCCSSDQILAQYDNKYGTVLYEKQLRYWAGGLSEIKIGHQQCLALSFQIPETGKQRCTYFKNNLSYLFKMFK